MTKTREALAERLEDKHSLVSEIVLQMLLKHEDDWNSGDPHAIVSAAVRDLSRGIINHGLSDAEAGKLDRALADLLDYEPVT